MSNKPDSQIKTAGAIELKQWQAPGDHPYADLVRSWLRSGDVIPEEVEEERETDIFWRVTADPGLSVIIRIYKVQNVDTFFHMEAAFGRIRPGTEQSVLCWLACKNYEFPHPFRLAALDEKTIVLQCRSYCDGFSAKHFQLRLETLIPLAVEVQKELTQAFGLLPFRSDADSDETAPTSVNPRGRTSGGTQ